MEMGARLRAARLSAKLTQRALGERVGITHAAICKYEKGMDVPSSGVLKRLATELGVPLAHFYRRCTVTIVPGPFRHYSKLLASDRKSVEGAVQEWLERYLAAESLCPRLAPAPNGGGLPDYQVSCVAEVEAAAEDLRNRWSLGTSPIRNMTEVLEERGIRVMLVQGMLRFNAQCFLANGTIPAIAVSAEHPGDRQRLSLGHELGHLVLRTTADLDAETAAYRFAGAFLIPRVQALGILGAERRDLELRELRILKKAFGVSMQAWVYRAKDLGIVKESAAKRLFHWFRATGHRNQEPGEQCPSERPARLERLVMQAYVEGAMTASRAAELLREDLGHFRSRLRESVDEPEADRSL